MQVIDYQLNIFTLNDINKNNKQSCINIHALKQKLTTVS